MTYVIVKKNDKINILYLGNVSKEAKIANNLSTCIETIRQLLCLVYTSSSPSGCPAFRPSPPDPSSSALALLNATSASSALILFSCFTIIAFSFLISSANSCNVLS